MNYSPRFAGAVSLDSLARRPQTTPPAATPPSGPNANGGAPVTVIDVTEASFQVDILDRSMTVPVVIDFWAEWCGPCKQLSPILERLAVEGGGAWVLAKIDVDSNQQLAAAAGVQGIPAVKAVWQGGIVGEFTGAVPEPQVRGWIGELLKATGAVTDVDADGAEVAEPPLPPEFVEAAAAFERGDYDAAEQAYLAILAKTPADQLAAGALAGVRLFKRAEHLDPVATRAATQAAPDDLDAQLAAADVDMLEGLVDQAFKRLVDVVARTSGADRDRARVHLLGLFDAAGPDDPSIPAARSALSRALF
jgi:putative thioredoxin